ncbi:MAG: AAA family ATPase, partial [Succinivibrio sp.]|nr:AAA family ATPase [Succinivibrio sp.]
MVDFKLTPASGEEGYAKLVTGHSYYVDKTFTLKDVFLKDKSAVLLITRPRRFGKT